MSAVFDKKGEDIVKLKREHEEEKDNLVKKIDKLTLDVDHQCELIDLTRSTAYYTINEHNPSQDEIDIKNTIDRIHPETVTEVKKRTKKYI